MFEAGKPQNFSGAVGQFQFSATRSKKSLIATEAFQLTLAVEGRGNLKLFELPNPNLPSTLEVYEPEYLEDINTTLSGTAGSISDTYTVVPNAYHLKGRRIFIIVVTHNCSHDAALGGVPRRHHCRSPTPERREWPPAPPQTRTWRE